MTRFNFPIVVVQSCKTGKTFMNAKRLQKKAALTTESLAMTKAMNQNENYEDDEIGFSSTTHKFA